jgi:hypothetical protein
MRLALAIVLAATGTAHAGPAAHWVRDHALVEWTVGTAGWRSGIDPDSRQPGFDAVGGGGELLAGLEIGSGVGLIASGRVLAATRGGDLYVEGLGGLGLHLRVNERVRLRFGAAGGRATLRDDAGVLVGGFAATSIDVVSFGGRLALALAARLDIDGLVGKSTLLPDSSLALALGLGIRY